MPKNEDTLSRRRPLLARSFISSLKGCVTASLVYAPLLVMPGGGRIRPMGLTAIAILASLATLGIAVPPAVSSMRQERRVALGLLAVACAFSPFVVSTCFLELIAKLKSFTLAE